MDVNKVFVAIIAFGINSGAYVAEIIRSGIILFFLSGIFLIYKGMGIRK